MGNVFQPEGNYYDKYNSKNPIVKVIMHNFFNNLAEVLEKVEFKTVLDAGCGEGIIANFVKEKFNGIEHIEGFDIGEEVISKAQNSFPKIHFKTSSIYETLYESDSFDLVVCCEVLEHLKQPDRALEEICRISSNYVLLSVPNEPIWRISNMLRGKYLKDFGNTPGHINHWGKKSIIKLISNYGEIQSIRTPFPWIMILLRKYR